MLTKAQAAIVTTALEGAARDLKTHFHGPDSYSVTGVNPATGDPFEVTDFDAPLPSVADGWDEDDQQPGSRAWLDRREAELRAVREIDEQDRDE